MAEQPGFVLQPEVAILRTRRQDHRARVEDLIADMNDLDRTSQVDLGDVVSDQFGTEASRLLAQAFHQLRAHDPVGEAGEVLHVGGGHQCAAGSNRALENQRVQVGPRGVERRRITGRTGSDDDELTHVHKDLPRRLYRQSGD